MSSNSTYYQYQDVKVKIAHRLMRMDGWEVFGYHEDASDSMTDYFDPAWWGGIAKKNGFTLVVDRDYVTEESTRTYNLYSEDAQPAEVAEKIAKLEKMTQANGASAQEEETAKAAIEKLREKKAAGVITKTEIIPGHLANPPRCNWHIEKDGIILDKGTGLLKFSSVADISGLGYPYELENWQKYNTMTREEWIADYQKRCIWGSYPTEEVATRAYDRAVEDYTLLAKFNELIARFNNVCGGMVGNNGESGYTYEERTETKYKKVWKFNPTEGGSFTAGQCFRLKASFTHGGYSGTVYRFEAFGESTVRGQRVSMKSGKSLTGSANASNSFGYYATDGTEETRGRDKTKFLKWVEQGAIEWGEVVEVSEPYEVKKYVKVDRNGNEYKPTKAAKAEDVKTEEKTETTTEYIIKADSDTRDGSPLWVVTLSAHVDRDSFVEIREEMKKNGGYYSKFKKGFIFKFDPSEVLNAEKVEEPAQEETKRKATPDDLRAAFGEIWDTVTRGRDLFISTNGNIYDDAGNLFYINMNPSDNPETIAACRDEETPEEPTKAAPGYTGESSDYFTPEEIMQLEKGEQIKKGNDYRRRAYFSTVYKNNVLFVYSVLQGDSDAIHPKTGADFCGFIYNSRYYCNFEEIAQEAASDIDAALKSEIPTEEAAQNNAVDLEKYEEERLAFFREHDFTGNAEKHFINNDSPSLVLYSSYKELSAAEIIRYITNPAEVVNDYMQNYKRTKRLEILINYITYNKTVAALKAIKADKTHRAHILKRINDATAGGSEKTFKIRLSNGHTIKADADAVRRLAYCGYISAWYVASTDRQFLNKDEHGRDMDIQPGEILSINHGSKTLYRAA